ncbi:Transposase [Gaiella occulta]|uniref:Transposase n=1 Tax=Gaiella occulta TaxID=1002870 RepID=A0A7M2YSX8_9ACTN|nr:IS110 family transposase [Gaiella occulta]RDI73195.1 Transposase [Gaiella occulta]
MSFVARLVSVVVKEGGEVRFIALDIHRDFCEVAIAEGGAVRSAPRVKTDPETLELFAASLGADDQVTLEATGNALAIARIIEPHVGRVVLADPRAVRGSASSALKTDKVDARILARLLAGGLVPEVWLPDERTRRLRRLVSRRAQLVRQRTRAKNQVHAALIRNLRPRQPMRDLFGAAGRRWLAAQTLPVDEQETVASCLREIDFLAGEIEQLERTMALAVLGDERMRRLLALPGISGVAACTLLAAIGDISRFPDAGHLVGYVGLNPRVRQSGSEKPRHGRISKQGPGEVRHVLVEAAWHAMRSPGPLRIFGERVAAKRGSNVAVVAVARKLLVIAWHLLSREEDYAFTRPSLVREKIRRLELLTGTGPARGNRGATRIYASRQQRDLELELVRQAERAYARLIKDWQPALKGAGAAPGRASSAVERQAARQETAPTPAL